LKTASFLNKLSIEKQIIGFSFLVLLFIFTGIYTETPLVAAIPFVILSGIFLGLHYTFFYWILIASIPLCIVYDFNSSLSTDFPTEFLCMGISAMYWIHILLRKENRFPQLVKHPLFLSILGLFLWAIITSITAQNKIIALKYTLAKTWYISVFLMASYQIIKTTENLKIFFWIFFIPLFFTVIYSFTRTILGNFDFEQTNQFSLPFYANHVLYATTMSIFFPFIILAISWLKKGTLLRLFLVYSAVITLIAIYFSYTRSCYIALLSAFIFIFLIKKRKSIHAFIFASILAIGFIFMLSKEYNYLKLQPDFTKTVMHGNFKDHLIATFQGKDASSMERLNMWISVLRMSSEHPIVGVGPNNFPFTYKPYSLYHFHTWVSDNRLNLSCHNYFLLMISEQGYIGFLLFFGFNILFLYYIEKYYHQSRDSFHKQIILALGASYIILLVNLLFSDLIETAKNGFFFYFLIAILIQSKKWIADESKR
jgi:O-antigen ligase